MGFNSVFKGLKQHFEIQLFVNSVQKHPQWKKKKLLKFDSQNSRQR